MWNIAGLTCEDGTVHLVGGNDVSRGRVEYCYEGTWYTVCASEWENNGEEARVICRTLGYSFGKQYIHFQFHVYILVTRCNCNKLWPRD